MRKTKILLSAFVVGMVFTACNGDSSSSTTTDTTKKKVDTMMNKMKDTMHMMRKDTMKMDTTIKPKGPVYPTG
ncbi:MAG TPA: hypothetical protein VKH37_01795 [Ferruginibacter sp.]|nr:hypothetical protein [Ferruginibacter sp.]